VGQLLAADDAFLRLRGQCIPTFEIVKIFLHCDIASTREVAVLLADNYCVDRRLARRILRSVDKTDEITVVEVTEPMHLVYRRNCITETRYDLRRQFEAQIQALRANVKQQVAQRRDGMSSSRANLTERM